MLFSSIPFLYYYLPCVLLLYAVAPRVLKNSVILLSSLVFYAWGEPRLVLLMLVTVLTGYVLGILTEKIPKLRKLFLAIAVVVFLGFLGYYKYTDFFIENFNAVTGLSIPLLRISLPIGISFYTFQILSYNIDVYRGDVPAQKNPIDLAAYISFFPQLIAGPIVRYSDIALQLKERTHSFDKIAQGIRRFIIGLSKKILIANVLGELCDLFKSSDEKSVIFYWMYGIAFCLHIYFDFSGYSDMAIGLGKLFGFHFLENFNYPYISKSVTEFWRRWHMSLGSWFRDYVYIPLGGNRVSKGRWFINIFAVWLFTGFWHGASWNFILWGLFFGVLLVIEKFWLFKYLDKTRVIGRVYILLAAMVSFMVFNIESLGEAFSYIGGLFGAGGVPFINAETIYYLRSYAVLLTVGIIGATPFARNMAIKLSTGEKTRKVMSFVEPCVLIVLLVAVTAFLVDSSSNPFLYFRF